MKSLNDSIAQKLAEHAAEYRIPYIETEHEHRYLAVVRKGRQGTDTWIITDGGADAFRYDQCRFTMGYEDHETWEDYHAATRRPLAEAFAQAEAIAAEMRQEWDERRAAMIARHEAEESKRTKAHP